MTSVDMRPGAPGESVEDPIISVHALTKVFGSGDTAVHALRGIDLDFERGKLTAVMGPSGSGKSTLMHCMVGLEASTSGTVTLNGQNVTAMNEKQLTALRRDNIGFIFQSFNLVPTLNARENIELPATIAGEKVDEERLMMIARSLGLEDRLTHRPAELSGGQQQRVACARALLRRPAVIIADEPTGNLDSAATAQVLEFLRASVDDEGQTVIMVTHEADAAAFADRVVFIADGMVSGELLDPTREQILDALKAAE